MRMKVETEEIMATTPGTLEPPGAGTGLGQTLPQSFKKEPTVPTP